jgi:hypothetical protein
MIDRHPGFKKRMQCFLENRKDLTEGLARMTECGMEERRLLSVVNRPRLERILQRVFDENEFLSPFGIRSLSLSISQGQPLRVIVGRRELQCGLRAG